MSSLVQVVLVQVEQRDREAALLACGVRREAWTIEPYAAFLEAREGVRSTALSPREDCRLFAEVALAIARARQDGVRSVLKLGLHNPGNPAGDSDTKALLELAAQRLREGVRDLSASWRGRAYAPSFILELQEAAAEWAERILGVA